VAEGLTTLTLTVITARVSVHPHADGRSVFASAVEEFARVVQRLADELVGVGEVDGRDAQRA
jgi:hypothetical protein